MNISQRAATILGEYQTALNRESINSLEELAQKILISKRVYIVAAGRTRCATEMFAMRLAQAGVAIYMVGDVTTPTLQRGDLLICASGSGKTKSVLTLVEIAKQAQGVIFCLTSASDTELTALADHTLLLPEKPADSTQLLGCFFETCLLLTLDLVVEVILEKTGITPQELSQNHANIQ